VLSDFRQTMIKIVCVLGEAPILYQTEKTGHAKHHPS